MIRVCCKVVINRKKRQLYFLGNNDTIKFPAKPISSQHHVSGDDWSIEDAHFSCSLKNIPCPLRRLHNGLGRFVSALIKRFHVSKLPRQGNGGRYEEHYVGVHIAPPPPARNCSSKLRVRSRTVSKNNVRACSLRQVGTGSPCNQG
jgi:hypothetical protein